MSLIIKKKNKHIGKIQNCNQIYIENEGRSQILINYLKYKVSDNFTNNWGFLQDLEIIGHSFPESHTIQIVLITISEPSLAFINLSS